MLTKSTPGADTAADLNTRPEPRSPWRVTSLTALPGYRLHVRFRDGLEGVVDMSEFLRSPQAGVFSALADPVAFNQAALEFGTPTWPGGLDLAPDSIHRAIAEREDRIRKLSADANSPA